MDGVNTVMFMLQPCNQAPVACKAIVMVFVERLRW